MASFNMKHSFLLYLLSIALLVAKAHCATPLDKAISACLTKAGVRNIIDTDKSWPQATVGFQLRLKPDPGVIAFPTTREQIAATLRCAVKYHTSVSNACGYHSFADYEFGKKGTLVIDLQAFNHIVGFKEDTGLFSFEGCIRVGPAAKWLWDNHKRHFPHVRSGNVGLTGSSFGGGFGSTTRFLGTTLDTIEDVEYMAYNGTVIKATASTNSELLWATKGAGPSLGVVLSMTIRTWKPRFQRAVNFTIELGDVDLDTGTKALLAIQDFALKRESPMSDFWALRWKLTAPNFDGVGYFYSDPTKFDSFMQPLMQKLPPAAKLTKNEYDFFQLDTYVAPGLDQPNGGESPGRAFYLQALTMTADKPFTYDLATTLYKSTTYSFNRKDMHKSGYLDLWGGITRYIKDSDSAFAHGNNLWLIRWQADAVKDWPADGVQYLKNEMLPFEKALKEAGYPIRGYMNYPDTGLTPPEWKDRLYGKNYDRLHEVKKNMDPTGVFTSADQSIPV